MDERRHEPRLPNCQIIGLWSSLHTVNWDNASKRRLRPRKFCGSGPVSRLPHEVERAGFLGVVTQKFAIIPQIVDPRDLGAPRDASEHVRRLYLERPGSNLKRASHGEGDIAAWAAGMSESFNPLRNGP